MKRTAHALSSEFAKSYIALESTWKMSTLVHRILLEGIAKMKLLRRTFVLAAMLNCIFICPAILGQSAKLDTSTSETPSHTTQLAKGEKSQPISIEDFSWLEGCWEGTGLGGKCTELWSGPEGGSVMGSFRYVSDDKVVFTEHFVIRKEGDSVALLLKHFDADFKGWEEKDKCVTFKFVKQDGDDFMFEGLTYRRMGKDKMEVYVVIEENSKRQEAKFEFSRKR
jgi:Domain of unknown function (DUF6265)